MSEIITNVVKQSKAIVLLLGLVFISACSFMGGAEETEEAAGNAEMKMLKGEVTFREKLISPNNVTLKVILFNSSKEHGKRDVVASMHKMISHTLPPYPFELEYDSSKLDANKAYAVEARIEVNGKVRMLPAEASNPFAEGVDSQNLVVEVQAVGASAAKQAIKGAEAPTSTVKEAASDK